MAFLNRRIHLAMSTTLIMVAAYLTRISGETVIEHQCYWCGPLAEEVHNSRRASPCHEDRPFEVAQCSRDRPYCAVVVTSPPYFESRVCTKYYQDECYARYCNTSRIWKMSCSCKGPLCNGAITEREFTAFNSIINLVTKTHDARPKRDSASSRIFARLRDEDQPLYHNTRHTLVNNQTNYYKTAPENEVLKPAKPDDNSTETLKSYDLKDSYNMSPVDTESGTISIPHSSLTPQMMNSQISSQVVPSPTLETQSDRTPITSNSIKPMTQDIVQNHQPPEGKVPAKNIEPALSQSSTFATNNIQDFQGPTSTKHTKNKAFVTTPQIIIIISQLTYILRYTYYNH